MSSSPASPSPAPSPWRPRRPAPAADTIRMRQANYKQMGGAMKGISDQLPATAPALARDPAATRRLLAGHGPQVLRWFPHGSGAEAGVRTRAKPEIWSDPRGFQRRRRASCWSPRAASNRRRAAATSPPSAPRCRRCAAPAAPATTDYRAPETLSADRGLGSADPARFTGRSFCSSRRCGGPPRKMSVWTSISCSARSCSGWSCSG